MAATKEPRGLSARPGWSDLCRAADELHAAEILLQDPVAAPRTALPHLRAFWQAAAQAGAAAGQAGADAGPESWLEGANAALGSAGQRKDLLAHVRALETLDEELSPVQMRRHARAARTLLAKLEPEIGGQPLRRRRRRRLLGTLGVVLTLAPVAAYLLVEGEIPGTGPWRAAYFPDRHLESTPVYVREDSLQHNWEDRPPHEQIPPDKFSARWDSCMVVAETTPAIFQLNANDGARLFIDGEEVIDAWDRNTATRRKGFGSGEIEL
ncbi:MAG: hypothetical protein KC457_06805, partial [Myxococcales bacterium]|nr:hypothetical protein [Myxococcales bacterium]